MKGFCDISQPARSKKKKATCILNYGAHFETDCSAIPAAPTLLWQFDAVQHSRPTTVMP